MKTLNDQDIFKIRSCLLDLYTDFANQSNALNARNDVSWDCYDKDNWNNLIDIVLDMCKILDINLDIEEEDNENN